MTLAGQVFDEWTKTKAVEVIPADPNTVAIIRLFLEKLEQLSVEERKELLKAICFLATQPTIVWNAQREVWEPREASK